MSFVNGISSEILVHKSSSEVLLRSVSTAGPLSWRLNKDLLGLIFATQPSLEKLSVVVTKVAPTSEECEYKRNMNN